MHVMKAPFRFVDLFSGAGGMSYGFHAHADFSPLLAVDAQVGKPSAGVGTLECNKTYERNIGIPVVAADLRQIEARDLLEISGLRRGQLDVLLACAPCTGFSRTLRKNHVEDDPRNHLVQRVGMFAEELRPAVVVMENARELISGNFSYHCERLADRLIGNGYAVRAEVHMLSAFGLPQLRERSLIVAVRDNGPAHGLAQLWKGHAVAPQATTVRRAIGHLPRLEAGRCDPNDAMHVAPKFQSEETLERLRALPKDGGSWGDLVNHPQAGRLLIPSMKKSVAAGDFGSHPDVYGRMWWDRPSATIKRECSHVGNGRYSHPEQDRMCSLRELALLNGFPTSYVFLGKSLSNRYRHVGDAVPPIISYQLAHLVSWILTGTRPRIQDCVLPETSLRATDVITQDDDLVDLMLDRGRVTWRDSASISEAKSVRDGSFRSTTADMLMAPLSEPSS